MKDILKIPGNPENVERLLLHKETLVPFIGAGFSFDACPGWEKFLETFFLDLCDKGFLTSSNIYKYQQIKTSNRNNRLEEMAHFLVDKAGRLKFQDAVKSFFERELTAGMKQKFDLFYTAFPGLKITTNFDDLIEANRPAGRNLITFYGYQPDELNRMLTLIDENSLLKIHGDIHNPDSIVLTKKQYEAIYGDPDRFKKRAALPKFLARVFQNSSVLFIGCSLETDRTVMVLNSLKEVRPHFAIMKMPKTEAELVALNKRMSDLRIYPIMITDWGMIDTILNELATRVNPNSKRVQTGKTIKHEEPVLFVGREKQLGEIESKIKQNRGNVQMITGKLFNIEGAGGIGKTTLAVEAAARFGHLFKDGVLAKFDAEKLTAMSFVVELAKRLDIPMNEPGDEETAQHKITGILRERELLIILDNVEDWKRLKFMLPDETCSTILVTTRSREMVDRILSWGKELCVHEIGLEKFSPPETLDLFRKMLRKRFNKEEESIYLEIGESLGYLPIALRQAISLMMYGPHYTAEQLRDKLNDEDRLELLRKGVAVEDSKCRVIEAVFDLSSGVLTGELVEALEVLAVCSPDPVPLSFLSLLIKSFCRSAGTQYPFSKSVLSPGVQPPAGGNSLTLNTNTNTNLEESFEGLASLSWVERSVKEGEKYFSMHRLVRDVVRKRYGTRFREAFVDVMDEIFTDKDMDFKAKDRLVGQLDEALCYMKESRDERLADDWIYDLRIYCSNRGYGHFFVRLTEVVEEVFPEDKWSLSVCYGHRALILQDWGRLEEAMSLWEKVVKIFEELGDRAGLSRSYGNQAIIYHLQGRLEEAMSLWEKVVKIFEELGDRAGLSRSYGNQALILQDWGKLDEAMNLHKKEEKIKEELGDRAGLAICWWNQGEIYNKKGDTETQKALWKKAIETRKAMGMPTEEYEKALEELLEN